MEEPEKTTWRLLAQTQEAVKQAAGQTPPDICGMKQAFSRLAVAGGPTTEEMQTVFDRTLQRVVWATGQFSEEIMDEARVLAPLAQAIEELPRAIAANDIGKVRQCLGTVVEAASFHPDRDGKALAAKILEEAGPLVEKTTGQPVEALARQTLSFEPF